ncbi:unnamed protein product [Gongylonema pulchrum]|uniref:Uncharacterized protein n=1 Tax=Gongylonema pulchrum TaxID=637853 RepID=A0A183DAX9_9BILA|nr:unnamed protein product [Gongylonema pulchrum]
MRKHYGGIIPQVMHWTLDGLSYFNRNDVSLECDKSMARDLLLRAAINLCRSLGSPNMLEIKIAYKLNVLFASLVITLLENVGQDDSPTAISLFKSACACADDFLCNQALLLREYFVTNLLDEAFAVCFYKLFFEQIKVLFPLTDKNGNFCRPEQLSCSE